MKILIDIPKEFEVDYNTDRFAEFFHRCFADMGTCCGNFEFETAVMMEKAFAESRIYDPDKVVKQLEEERELSYADFDRYAEEVSPCLDAEYDDFFHRGLERAIKIVKGGGTDAEN